MFAYNNYKTTHNTMNNSTHTISPRIKVVKIDETQNWRDDIQEKAGKIFGVYFFDEAEITHCCSLEGSYALHWLYNIVENENNFDEDELVEIELDSGGDDDERYFSEYYNFNDAIDIPSLKWDAEEETYEDFMESCREYLKANHVI